MDSPEAAGSRMGKQEKPLALETMSRKKIA
jgi:hypothetical protein